MKLKYSQRSEEFLPHFNRWFELHYFPTKEGISIYLTDITERKNLEREKDQFIDIASHELKSPVTTIWGYAQLLEKRFKKLKDKQSLKYLTNMNNSITQLNSLVSDLLDATHLASGNRNLNKSVFKLDPLVKEIVLNFKRTHENNQIHFIGKTSHNVLADRNRITQVTTNLITNAIKYSPKNSEVIIKLNESKSHVKISVTDHGIGIPKEDLSKIFDRYYRVRSPNSNQGGVGLGLYISSEIIKAHKGEISVKSTLGKGSTFSFTLPLQKKKLSL